ncbi:phosphotransferase family protein [Paenibacillus pinistramenti]|uniref:phosphotransferase family protein n=1 Tax=Paenibacillus pinistramenti TaxID=1768003 RepID=UPI001108EC6D|nr:phosphotransferase family protein [Paenibacillus pinistramenti]
MAECTEDAAYAAFTKIIKKIEHQAKLLRIWNLQGGVSAQTTAVEFEAGGHCKRAVVRQYGEANLRSNSHIARSEWKLLNLLHAAGIPVPKPYFADESANLLPAPYIVIEFIEGQTRTEPADVHPLVRKMGDVLAKIHSHKFSEHDLSFLPAQEHAAASLIAARPAKLDDSLSEGRIRDTLEQVWPPPQKNKSALLHGDFWPGNLLWKVDQIAAVIDWEDAGCGDPLSDFANARLEILMFFGIESMNEFTRHYRSLMASLEYTNLPYWDLIAALRPAGRMSGFGLDRETLLKFRERHKRFVNQALDRLNL